VPVAGVLLAAVGERPGEGGASPRLLVLRALGLGDLLTAVPALRALRRAYPDHRLVLAAPGVLEPLAALSGAVDEVCDAAPLAPLDASLAGAEIAVNLHGRGPQSHHVLMAARPRRLVAFAHSEVAESRAGPRWTPGEHEVVRWCRLLAESGIAADPALLDLDPPSGEPPHPAAHGATVIHPGAASPARRWPPERFAAVARAERESGRTVLLTGSRAERALATDVARGAGLASDDAVLAGRTDLLGLARIVAAAGRVVCGDTGVAHLATALGTPSVVLFGPTSPEEWGPPVERGHHAVLWAGRRGDPHGSEPDPGLLDLSVADVLAALRELPARGAARARAAA
jgi:ADP-heptose:LPS heptosyltransferase